jgi:hypothetical protein
MHNIKLDASLRWHDEFFNPQNEEVANSLRRFAHGKFA